MRLHGVSEGHNSAPELICPKSLCPSHVSEASDPRVPPRNTRKLLDSSHWTVGVSSMSLVVFTSAFERPSPFANTKRFPKWLQFAKCVARVRPGACQFLTPMCAPSAVGARISSASAPLLKARPAASMYAPHASSRAKSSRPAAKGTHAGRH